MTTVLNTTKKIMADVFGVLFVAIVFGVGVPIAALMLVLMTTIGLPILTIIYAVKNHVDVCETYLDGMCGILKRIEKIIEKIISVIKN